MTRKSVKWAVLITILIVVVIIYKKYNPLSSAFFPKCPFKYATGLDCPGCGSQRAIHHLLNFDILSATKENILLVISIPYIIVGLIFDFCNSSNKTFLKWRKMLFGQTAIIIILIVVISFWIFRNII